MTYINVEPPIPEPEEEFTPIYSLTNKQLLFCQEYLVDLNGGQAAIRSGYSPTCAYEIASENLRKPGIRQKITELMSHRAKRTEITADRVLAELGNLAFADIRKIFTKAGALIDPANLPDDIASAIQSVEIVTSPSGQKDDDGYSIPEHIHKIKLVDKKGALELLGKHLKLFADRIEHTSPDGSMTPKSPSLDASKLSMDTLKELLAAREAQKTEE